MQSVARLRHYRGSAQKVRLVADLIRMKPVGQAVATLRTTRKTCSEDILKLVESAVANAQQKESGLDTDGLVVQKIHVDGAGRKPLQRNAMIRSVSNYKKRFARPRFMSGPQGRMWLVPRPFCHITVILSDDPEARKAAGLKAEIAKPLVARGKKSRVQAAVDAARKRPGSEKAAEPKDVKDVKAAQTAKAQKSTKKPAKKAAKPAPAAE